jgi:hypothetical protein
MDWPSPKGRPKGAGVGGVVVGAATVAGEAAIAPAAGVVVAHGAATVTAAIVDAGKVLMSVKEDRPESTTASDSSANEKHGDSGRAQAKAEAEAEAEKQINELKQDLKEAKTRN